MLRKNLLLLFVLFYSAALHAQEYGAIPEIKTTLDFNAGGAVKSIYEITYAVQFAQRTLVDSTIYTDTLLSRSKETNTLFNEDGYLLSNQIDSFDDKAKTILSKKVVYHYDKKRITGILHYENDKLLDSCFTDYDRKGAVDEQTFYDHKGRLVTIVQYFYRNGNIFNIKVRDEHRMLINFIRFKYNYEGNVTEEEINGSSMQYQHSYKYEYDTLKDGSRQVIKYDQAGRYKYRSMTRYVYDPKGNMTGLTITDSNKRVVENHIMTYTPGGLLQSALIFTEFRNEYEYRYEYDDRGYWKTMYRFVNDKLNSKTHRVTEYYEEGQK